MAIASFFISAGAVFMYHSCNLTLPEIARLEFIGHELYELRIDS